MRTFQGQRQPVAALAFLADGRHVAAGDGDGVGVHDATTGETVQRIPLSRGAPRHFAPLPSGSLVVATRTELNKFLAPTKSWGHVGFYPHDPTGEVRGLAASADGKRLFGVADRLHCWDTTPRVATGKWAVPPDEGDMFRGVAVSPDGKTVAAVRGDGVALYAAAGGRFRRLLVDHPAAGAMPVAWSPDGGTLALLDWREVTLYSAADGAWLAAARPDGRRAFTEFAYHPSGQLLVGCNDGTVRVYAGDALEVRRTFAWPVGKVKSVAVSPDGTLAACGGDKGQVVVWDWDV